MEELKMLRAEKELRELRESSSNEKRKRDTTPIRPKGGKVRSRTGLLKKGGRVKTPKPVEVSSDEGSKEKDAVVQNLDGKLGESGGNMKEVLVLKDLIQELLAAKGKDHDSCNTGDDGKKTEKKLGKTEHGGLTAEKVEGHEELEPGTAKESGKDDLAPDLYFRDRVVYYDAMHYTEIQTLCKKKGIAYKKKEAGVWELARLDFEVLQKLEKSEEEENVTEIETSEDDDGGERESSSESERESAKKENAGN
ncbi:hypothetical protein CBR_g17838 [Chara braunii]|uniref:Uncharacterized protein n=1 Tax=Chara braunii TaxID=69332 RepID=A0A388KVQ4_CHABU|nr:hypothetical protein CBR_g17838 [Chara braunii]|eukprot:GBG74127.1 hypothetical protein CBR_g17838 [Chara braunii]